MSDRDVASIATFYRKGGMQKAAYHLPRALLNITLALAEVR